MANAGSIGEGSNSIREVRNASGKKERSLFWQNFARAGNFLGKVLGKSSKKTAKSTKSWLKLE